MQVWPERCRLCRHALGCGASCCDVTRSPGRRPGYGKILSYVRCARHSLVEEIERLRAKSADGDITIGGAALAGEAALLGEPTLRVPDRLLPLSRGALADVTEI